MNDYSKLPVVDAEANLYFQIKPTDKEGACRLDKCDCVIARAVKRQYPGLADMEIGAHASFVVLKDRKIRYMTTTALRDGLVRFDETGEWKLKKGIYHLLAPSKKAKREALRERAKKLRADRQYDKDGNRYAATGRCKKSSINARQSMFLSQKKTARVAS